MAETWHSKTDIKDERDCTDGERLQIIDVAGQCASHASGISGVCGLPC